MLKDGVKIQKNILAHTQKSLFKNRKETKYIIRKKRVSNLEIFKTASKILTFSGTPHIEAMCFGLKSIIISDVTLSAISKNLF